jgi:hypothetical protein
MSDGAKIRAEHAALILAEAAARALLPQSDAMLKLDAHEEVCTVRWENCLATMREIKESIKGLQRQLWVAAGAVITSLLGTVLFLAARVIH